ncbi:MAG: hypothetical protein DRI46_11810 [Chloroflexi bacterium]|nr:MAG: hypothetical protein DRI46_11810 [Chloroflexota bacterium]
MLSNKMKAAASGGGPAGPQYAVGFNGATTLINCGSYAGLDNLPTADFTLEGWFRIPVTGVNQIFFAKGKNGSGGYRFYINTAGNRVQLQASYDGTDINSNFVIPTVANDWHHLAFVYDFGTLSWSLFFDGIQKGSIAGVGNYEADTIYNLVIGMNYNNGLFPFAGKVAWVRGSRTNRYTASFTPAAKDDPPPIDANTIEQWNMNEGSGSTAAAMLNPLNNGAITDGSWIAL